MKWIYWGSVAVIGYAYLGYAAWLWVRNLWSLRPVQSGPYLPSISIAMVVHNEAAVLERKLRNLLDLNYRPDRTEIVVVSDGSTDDTNRILAEFASVPRVRVILNPQARGKAVGLNDAMAAADGEIVIFTDARQKIEADAVGLLLENFADPQVGCVSGELMLGDPGSGETGRGMGLYWKIEKKIREMESASGSVVGATGALYAVRRSLLVELPPETILDDVYIPMHVLRQGSRVVFDPRARVWDVADQGVEREFARKVRTLSGNYQLFQLSPWVFGNANPVRFGLVSHKLIRLLVPFALAALLFSSFFLPGPIYRIALALQVAFYGLSAWALVGPKRGPLGRVADVAFTLVLLNMAAVVAFAKFVTGRKVVWAR
jgi:cellulose synthase/poly-beta-1,6-N-acetylglucosamine synthase-like glycosyltransferase